MREMEKAGAGPGRKNTDCTVNGTGGPKNNGIYLKKAESRGDIPGFVCTHGECVRWGNWELGKWAEIPQKWDILSQTTYQRGTPRAAQRPDRLCLVGLLCPLGAPS